MRQDNEVVKKDLPTAWVIFHEDENGSRISFDLPEFLPCQCTDELDLSLREQISHDNLCRCVGHGCDTTIFPRPKMDIGELVQKLIQILNQALQGFIAEAKCLIGPMVQRTNRANLSDLVPKYT